VWNGGATSAFYSMHLNEYNTIPTGKHKIRFTTNHDESAWDSSPFTLFNGKWGALAASVPAIFMGGVPLIYSGQEVGRASTTPFFTKSPINWAANPDMLVAYKQMMQIYVNSEAARKGTLTNYNNSSNVLTFKKSYGNEELLTLVNVRDSIVNYTIPAALQNTTWNDQRTNTVLTLGTTLSLPAYSYYLLKN
jgi:glycosidase